MPILTLHYRNQNPTDSPSTDDDKFARQKLRMSSLSVPIQKLTLVGYCINLRKHATLASGKSHQKLITAMIMCKPILSHYL